METEIYRCQKCDFEFDDEDALETHHELYHENEYDICDKCDADFDEEDALETHKELYHENEYKCNICDYVTTTQTGVNIHKGAKHKQTFSNCNPDIIMVRRPRCH